jgi:hypothetical protein
MNIKNKAILMATVSCSLGFSAHSFAGEKLDAVNAQVKQKAAAIDQKHGVLLDYQERNALKLDLIAQQALIDSTSNTTETVKEITDSAITIYEISDLTEQRKLLIKLEAQAARSTGNGGTEPDYP